MADRPLSERHHEPPEPDNRFEVRVHLEADGAERWRTISVSASREDAVLVASALVEGDGAPFAWAEVWGPGRTPDAHRTVVDRLPPPDRDERRQMWLRAADENYSASYSDTRH